MYKYNDKNPLNKRYQGMIYETQALHLLESKGYQILERNYHCRAGEIDIIALDDKYLVFVEVKFRTNDIMGHPLEAVTREKQKHMIYTANYYLIKHPEYLENDIRFDVIGILGEQITHLEHAFDI